MNTSILEQAEQLQALSESLAEKLKDNDWQTRHAQMNQQLAKNQEALDRLQSVSYSRKTWPWQKALLLLNGLLFVVFSWIIGHSL